jgi:predicted DCC family thiol-disulfide oxidoreductase YuxK
VTAGAPPPVLVFDGDCSFCRIWVGYWKAFTGDRVEYVPYQLGAERFPNVPLDDFRKSVQFFNGDRRASGAAAVFQLLAYGGQMAWPRWVYEHVPGVAPLTEAGYRFIAAHRNAGYRVTRLFWGSHVVPASYVTSTAIFARVIALIYLIAFASFGRQVRGLIGEQGIQPVNEFYTQVLRSLGPGAFWRAPGIFWWIRSDYGLEFIVWSGAVLSFVCAVARPHSPGQRAGFVVLFFYYLSIVNAGQIFMGYQWDFLLLEAGFLAIFLKPAWSRTFLFRWLLVRLMLESGAVKLLSRDPVWRNLTALSYHYETQPLPTPLAWYMAQAPMWFLKFSTLWLFMVELALPFLMLGPRRLKQIAAWGTISLQVIILLTGNYTFFNLLTIAFCLFLFDDVFWRSLSTKRIGIRPARFLTANQYASVALFLPMMAISLLSLASVFGYDVPALTGAVLSPIAPWGIVNQYGLFANMTTTRPEIDIEGSNDGADWKAYTFRYKPGPLNRAPGVVEPSQPRLDWQMWFAALSNYRENPWLIRFLMRLLQGSRPVLDLLAENPFADHPPRYVRAVVYDYRFTNFDERRKTGNWWKREMKGLYFPPVSLRGQP